MARTPRRRSRWADSGSSTSPISTPPWSGPVAPPPHAKVRSRCGRWKVSESLDAVFRREAGRCTATLIRVLGDVDLAEDAVAEAFAIAAERWPKDGLPPNPGGWIVTTARNRAIDRLRRESSRHDRHVQALALSEPDDEPLEPDTEMQDDRLRLIFTCCHPSLAPAAQIALTLRLLGGLEVNDISRAFLVPE